MNEMLLLAELLEKHRLETQEKDKRIAELEELIDLTGLQYNVSRTAFMNREVRRMNEYQDMDGNPTTLYKLVRIEPDWAVSRIYLMNNKIAEMEKERDVRDLEQQANGAIKLTNAAMKKLQSPKCYQLRLEYFKAGVRALAFAIDKESKALKEQGE